MESQDPMMVFCEGVMMIVLDKLDMRSLAVARLVSKDWLKLASIDQLWEHKCQELWVGKAHVPWISRVPGISKMEAITLSIVDAKRTRIFRSDLCDHAWDFSCSEAARHRLDPIRSGPARRYFHRDGSMTQQGEGDNEVWDVNGSTYSVVIAEGEREMREQFVRINLWPHLSAVMSNWFPHLSIVRRPDWGWVLLDHLNCYSSIPDADKVEDTGPLSLLIGDHPSGE